jgi:hypothetical protein
VAIFPNSVIAKSTLVNCSTPATVHGAPSVTVKDVSAVEPVQNELFDRVYRAAAAAGASSERGTLQRRSGR